MNLRSQGCEADSSPLDRREISFLGWAILAALSLRIYIALTTAVIAVDGIEYIHAADIIKAGGISAVTEHFYPPGYPVLVNAARLLVSDPERAGQLVSLIFGLLLIIVVYLFVRETFGRKPAVIAALLIVIQHQLSKYSVQVRAESVFFTMQMTAIWLALRVSRGERYSYPFLCGLAAAAAFYARPEEGVVLIVFLSIWIFIELARKRKNVLASVAAALICAVTFSALTAPFIVAVQGLHTVGRESRPAGFHVSRKRDLASDSLRDNLDRKLETASTNVHDDENGMLNGLDPQRGEAALWTGERVSVYFSRIIQLIRKFGISLHLFCAVFLLIGIFYRRRTSRNPAVEIMTGVFALVMLLVFALILPSHRHTVQLIAPLSGFIAVGVCEAAALSASKYEVPASNGRTVFITGLIMALMTFFYLAETIKPRRIEHIALRKAGEYISLQAKRARLLTPEVPVVFYSKGDWVLDPARDEYDRRGKFTLFGEKLSEGVQAGADFLVLETSLLETGAEGGKGPLSAKTKDKVKATLENAHDLYLEKVFLPHPWFPGGDSVSIYRIVRQRKSPEGAQRPSGN